MSKKSVFARKKRGRKVCKFCANKNRVIDYKDVDLLEGFTSDRGKIVPRRISGNCARHQRRLTIAIKRGRNIALIPYTVLGE